jgi:hypothetical protein
MPGVPEVCLQHVRHLAKAGSAGTQLLPLPPTTRRLDLILRLQAPDQSK